MIISRFQFGHLRIVSVQLGAGLKKFFVVGIACVSLSSSLLLQVLNLILVENSNLISVLLHLSLVVVT